MSWLKIKKFWRLKWQFKYLFFITLAVAAYSWVLFTFFKSRAKFKSSKHKKVKEADNVVLKRAGEIRWAIAAVSRIIFWKNVCRHQAYQAVTLLKHYKVPYRVLVGFKKDEEGSVIGHVWTTVEKQMITGFCNADEYTIISVYEG
jgi:hypothetical protein